jgi:hypothetical protein
MSPRQRRRPDRALAETADLAVNRKVAPQPKSGRRNNLANRTH